MGSKPSLDEQLDGFGGDVEVDLLGTQPLLDLSQQDADDVAHVVARERVEHDHVVDAIQELRVEGALQLVLDRALDLLELLRAVPSACLNPRCRAAR